MRLETIGWTIIFNGELRIDQIIHVQSWRHGRYFLKLVLRDPLFIFFFFFYIRIVVGAGGATLAAITNSARQKLSETYDGKKVHLFIRVKAKHKK